MNKLSSKDLDGISDLLTYEESICKKMEVFAQGFTDTELQTLATTLAAHHRNRYNSLLGFINK